MDNGMLPPSPDQKTGKRFGFIIAFLYYLILFGLSVLFVRYALPHLWAFVIALIVVWVLYRPAKAISHKLKLDYKGTSVFLVILFYATIGVALFFLVFWLVGSATRLIGRLPSFARDVLVPNIKEAVTGIEENLEELNTKFNLGLNLNLSEIIGELTSTLVNYLSDFSKNIITNAPTIAGSLSSLLINLVVCIVSTAFGLMDFDLITAWIKKQLSAPRVEFFSAVTSHLGSMVGKFIASYSLIMLITYCELAAGLLIILQAPKAFAIAGVIAVMDILPIIGSGLFLCPWAVISLFMGKIGQGIGLFILWIILSIIRNIIEPKIVGNKVGMHPLLTLLAMMVGEFIYGGIGIILLPIGIAVAQEMNSEGIIHIYKTLGNDDYKEPEKDRLSGILSHLWDVLSMNVSDYFRKKSGKTAGTAKEAPSDSTDASCEKPVAESTDVQEDNPAVRSETAVAEENAAAETGAAAAATSGESEAAPAADAKEENGTEPVKASKAGKSGKKGKKK